MKAMYGILLLLGYYVMLLPEALCWAFAPASSSISVSRKSPPSLSRGVCRPRRLLLASNKNSNKEEGSSSSSSSVVDDSGGAKGAALPPSSVPSSSSSSSNTSDNNKENDNDDDDYANSILSQASTAIMINQESKRVLIEELGYRRADVERLKPQLAAPIIARRLRRPPTAQLPESWVDTDLERQKRQLESESRYPLKFPLLGLGLVLLGKGLGDLIITLVKVNTDFPGASLTEEFQGVPVLLVDAVCVALGAAVAGWTWKTMRDD